jgi:hypothetical protein
MARYQVRYVTYAEEQLRQLPASLCPAFDARLEDLKDDPYSVGDRSPEDKRSYTTTFGKPGIIQYVVSDEILMVTVIRVNWVDM